VIASGTDPQLTSIESSFYQDINSDGAIGTATVFGAFGSTRLTQVGNNYSFYNGGSGVTLKFTNTAVVTGQFGAWTPIAVEQTASGYTAVLKMPGTDQYTVWLTDSNGNYQSSVVIASGTDPKLTSLESSFHQDINSDGATNAAATTVIEGFGSTQLMRIGNNYGLDTGGSSVTLKFTNTAVVSGQFGAWTPFAAEQTASGYTLVLKVPGADQYTVWLTANNGNYKSSVVIASGADPKLTSLESSFSQDLNGDGVISPAAATIVNSAAMNLEQSAVTLHNEQFVSDLAHFVSTQDFSGWHFNMASQSGSAGMAEPEGLSLNGVASQLLTKLLNDVASSQNTAFTTADGAHDTLVNQDSGTKAFVADLHTGFLIH